MAAGRFDAPLPAGGGDEIGDLTRSLDTMRPGAHATPSTCSPPSATGSRRSSTGSREAVIVVGEDGEVRFTNPAAGGLVRDGQPATALIPSLRRAAEQGSDQTPIAGDRRPRLRGPGAQGARRARGAAGGPRPDRGAEARAGRARVRLQRRPRAPQPAGRRSRSGIEVLQSGREGRPGCARPVPQPARRRRRADDPPDPVPAHPGPGGGGRRARGRPRWWTSPWPPRRRSRRSRCRRASRSDARSSRIWSPRATRCCCARC